MANRIPYLDKKSLIRNQLLELAKAPAMRPMTYTEFGKLVGIPSQGPWKLILDHVADEERVRGLPDLTFMVINKRTGYPGQIGGEPAHPPSDAQKRRAKAEFQKLIDRYNPGARNPF